MQNKNATQCQQMHYNTLHFQKYSAWKSELNCAHVWRSAGFNAKIKIGLRRVGFRGVSFVQRCIFQKFDRALTLQCKDQDRVKKSVLELYLSKVIFFTSLTELWLCSAKIKIRLRSETTKEWIQLLPFWHWCFLIFEIYMF